MVQENHMQVHFDAKSVNEGTLSRYTSSAAAKNKRSMALPASYDPRGTEQETPIRNQQDTGACWAFGALKALESDCLMKGS